MFYAIIVLFPTVHATLYNYVLFCDTKIRPCCCLCNTVFDCLVLCCSLLASSQLAEHTAATHTHCMEGNHRCTSNNCLNLCVWPPCWARAAPSHRDIHLLAVTCLGCPTCLDSCTTSQCVLSPVM